MCTITSRDFRQQMASFFDKAMRGEEVVVRRNNQLYAIVPLPSNALTITKELQDKIEKAKAEYMHGETISLHTHEEIDNWLENL